MYPISPGPSLSRLQSFLLAKVLGMMNEEKSKDLRWDLYFSLLLSLAHAFKRNKTADMRCHGVHIFLYRAKRIKKGKEWV
jgi:hypothetical protein